MRLPGTGLGGASLVQLVSMRSLAGPFPAATGGSNPPLSRAWPLGWIRMFLCKQLPSQAVWHQFGQPIWAQAPAASEPGRGARCRAHDGGRAGAQGKPRERHPKGAWGLVIQGLVMQGPLPGARCSWLWGGAWGLVMQGLLAGGWLRALALGVACLGRAVGLSQSEWKGMNYQGWLLAGSLWGGAAECGARTQCCLAHCDLLASC